jgi:hypothetical protein
VLVAVLLVVALASLCVGLFLSSSAWLLASLTASVLAGLLMHRSRVAFTILRLPTTRRTRARYAAGAAPPGTGAELGAKPPDADVWVLGGRPRYHRRGCQIIRNQDAEAVPLSQARDDGFIACSLCQPALARGAGRGVQRD